MQVTQIKFMNLSYVAGAIQVYDAVIKYVLWRFSLYLLL